MTPPVTVLLDADQVRVLSARGEMLATEPWIAEQPTNAFDRLRTVLSSSTGAVIVVGMGLLDIARPELPPLPPGQLRALLLRDADRYFPTSEPVAVSVTNGFACAVHAGQLQAWTRLLSDVCTVRGTATVLECLSRTPAHGRFALPSGAAEQAVATFDHGQLRDVSRAAYVSGASAQLQTQSPANAPAPPLDLRLVAVGAARVSELSLDAMLLDSALLARFSGARRRRWLQSAAVFMLAVGALAWSADRARTRQLDDASEWLNALTATASPARQAQQRLERARTELALLTDSLEGPAEVLAALGTALPSDAFVQRLEWDGALWRIEGSALDAPRIVPLLDQNPRFSDVRITAASTRFLDAGRQRESFSMSFRARGGSDDAR
ncbi:MAG: PilN domain-containing protein [Gemmatimonadota bacterium]